MNVLIAGQKWFGAEVLRSLARAPGVCVVCVVAPAADRMAALAEHLGVPSMLAGGLTASTMPKGVDLIVAAHSHDFIGERTRLRARLGAVGYHPSLLPLHRGRDAIRWAIHMGDRVTGGTVYRLSNRVDGGAVLAQEHTFIRPGDTPRELWERDLGPRGVRMLTGVVAAFARGQPPEEFAQDEQLATWEPSFERQPLARPDLLLLPGPGHFG